MELFDSKGRQLFDVEFDGRGKETFIRSAVYEDGSEVPEDELDEAARGECLCFQCRECS